MRASIPGSGTHSTIQFLQKSPFLKDEKRKFLRGLENSELIKTGGVCEISFLNHVSRSKASIRNRLNYIWEQFYKLPGVSRIIWGVKGAASNVNFYWRNFQVRIPESEKVFSVKNIEAQKEKIIFFHKDFRPVVVGGESHQEVVSSNLIIGYYKDNSSHFCLYKLDCFFF